VKEVVADLFYVDALTGGYFNREYNQKKDIRRKKE